LYSPKYLVFVSALNSVSFVDISKVYFCRDDGAGYSDKSKCLPKNAVLLFKSTLIGMFIATVLPLSV